jgi:hypothetical protein
MGYIRHHAIIVTAYRRDDIEAARLKALECFEGNRAVGDYRSLVGPVMSSVVNSYHTLFIAPDGSKEGWPESDVGDNGRSRFIAWLDKQRWGDGSSPFRWAEIQYGDDDHDNRIIGHDAEEGRRQPGDLELWLGPNWRLREST